MTSSIQIRKAELSDYDAIWNIIEQVIAGGDTYVFAPDSDRTTMLDYWCGSDKQTYLAEIEHEVVGTFIIKDNFPGLGSHVANASYMTKPGAFGKGIGRVPVTPVIETPSGIRNAKRSCSPPEKL